METLKEHFAYEPVDLKELPEIFRKLSETLELIHSKGAVVNLLNSDTTLYDTPEFTSLKRPENQSSFEKEKKDNIVALGKMMVGCYVSKETGFTDFSGIKTEWFVANEENIFKYFQYDDFDREYFKPLFENDMAIERGIAEEIAYYHVYLRRKEQAEKLRNISGSANEKGTTKALISPYYKGTVEDNSKAARLHVHFNPLLIVISIAAIAVIVTMISLLN